MQRDRGRAIVAELLAAEATEQVAAGQDAWSLVEQQAMAEAIDAALFGLGRLQPLVDDDRVENIVITGHARVFLELVDGTVIPGPPVADSDSELIDFLVFLASRSEVNARAFSEAVRAEYVVRVMRRACIRGWRRRAGRSGGPEGCRGR